MKTTAKSDDPAFDRSGAFYVSSVDRRLRLTRHAQLALWAFLAGIAAGFFIALY